jgi:hypothetical protein
VNLSLSSTRLMGCPVLLVVSASLPLQVDRPPARTQDDDMVHQSATNGHQRTRPLCEMGKAQKERRQGIPRPRNHKCVRTRHLSPVPNLTVADSEIASAKTQFSLKFNSALWFMTTGLQFFIGWWYRKSAVFYLPQGWFGPLTWWLGLPWAPAGSVSCGVWQMACRRIILVLERTVKGFWCRSIPRPSFGQFQLILFQPR